MAKKKEINVQYIADLCNVSIATVSRVLNNDKRVSDKTREKILTAMQENNYVSHQGSKGKIDKIGIIVDTEISNYYMALVTKLTAHFNKENYQLIFSSLQQNPERLPFLLDTMYDAHVKGIFLIHCGYLSIKSKLDSRIPHVWIDCTDTPEQTKNICQVSSDHYYSGQLAAQEFIQAGCKKPIIVGSNRISYRTTNRINGFRDELKKRNIDFSEDQIISIPKVDEVVTDTSQTIRYLISTGFQFDGIFAISDWRTIGVMQALRDMNIKIPEDVKLIGFDGVSVINRLLMNITCIQQNVDLISIRASEYMSALLNHESIKEKYTIVPTHLIAGKTL